MASGGGRRRQPKPRARARGKAKRTKYLSLSDLMVKAEMAATPPSPPAEEDEPASPLEAEQEVEVKPEEDAGGEGGDGRQQHQGEPFALHHHGEASTLFEALPAPSLSDILGPSSPSASRDGSGSGNSGRLPGAQEEDLARRALRGRERWVYCSSPAATATPTATATTSSSSPCSSAASTGASARSLLLKLDYEEILAKWADRGSLYIGPAGAGGGSGGSPDMQLDAVQVLVVEPSEHAVAALSGRAERVRRYKEKRRRRLFAKRIRYEVRRVNAVKRPRFKGRFIKEHEESELRPT